MPVNLYYNITLSDTAPIREWSIDPKNVCTGVDIPSDIVYSYCDGVVLAVGKVDNHYCVTVQYDVYNLLRYDHLSAVYVGAGDNIQAGATVGKADQFVHFEYATKEQNNSKWSVRVGTQTYWKQNPKGLM
jgi:murein DD-endopeptidase MepM/ murein hydrolase activator NlpD